MCLHCDQHVNKPSGTPTPTCFGGTDIRHEIAIPIPAGMPGSWNTFAHHDFPHYQIMEQDMEWHARIFEHALIRSVSPNLENAIHTTTQLRKVMQADMMAFECLVFMAMVDAFHSIVEDGVELPSCGYLEIFPGLPTSDLFKRFGLPLPNGHDFIFIDGA